MSQNTRTFINATDIVALCDRHYYFFSSPVPRTCSGEFKRSYNIDIVRAPLKCGRRRMVSAKKCYHIAKPRNQERTKLWLITEPTDYTVLCQRLCGN